MPTATMAGAVLKAGFIFLFLALLPLPLASTQTTYYVRPTSESQCHHEDCFTLSEYASETSKYFNSDNLTLVFLPGEHALNTSIDFQLFDSLTLLGDLSSLPNITSRIVCNETTALSLKYISKVEIKALAFVFCGIQGSSRNHYIIPPVSAYDNYKEVPSKECFPSNFCSAHSKLPPCQLSHGTQSPSTTYQQQQSILNNKFEGNIGGIGGVVAAYDSTVVFLGQNLFLGNNAEVGGGVFANRSELVFTGSTAFVDNIAEYGGGIGAKASTIIYGNTANTSMDTSDFNFLYSRSKESIVFVQNQALSDGGGIWLLNSTMRHNGTLNITGEYVGVDGDVIAGASCFITLHGVVIFERNSATEGSGGAVAALSSTWWFTVSTFVGNSAQYSGGAVSSYNSQLKFGTCVPTGIPTIASEQKPPPDIHYYQSQFRNNSARFDGGAIGVYRSTIEFSGNSNFDQNSAGECGGGVRTLESVFMFTGYTTFKNNLGSSGGGIYASSSQLHFQGHTKFAGNCARYDGGGIRATDGSTLVFLEEIGFFSNEAQFDGGGIELWSRNTLIISGNATYVNNAAGGSGGVVSAYDSALNMSGDGTYINNTAGGYGGVVSAKGNTVIVFDGENTMATSSAGISGGAVSVEDGTLRIAGKCNFVENGAHYRGGALYAEESDLNLSGVNSFISNVAETDGYGGGIHAAMTVLTLNGLHTFTDNSARRGGALAVTEQSTLSTNGNINFRENCASNGGAIFADEGSDLVFSGVVTFDSNVARSEGNGGGLHSENSTITFSGLSNFTNNSAGCGGALAVRKRCTLYVTGITNFIENYASNGGAVFAAEGSDLEFSGVVTFDSNVAKSVQFAYEGYGGGIHSKNSKIAFSGLSNFVNNSATYGGALALKCFSSFHRQLCAGIWRSNLR